MLKQNMMLPIAVDEKASEREKLYEKFKEKIKINVALDRTLVSSQANKNLPYNWFRYREGFSEALVRHLLTTVPQAKGVLLDPFVGSGTALQVASELGWKPIGIELLPVGIYVTKIRLLAQKVNPEIFCTAINKLLQHNFLDYYDQKYALKHIRITNGAFPAQEEQQITGYIACCHMLIEDENVRDLLLFGAFCVLEEISYTRKDGQYLRWDERSGRSQGAIPFNKGRIFTFREAIEQKLRQMLADIKGRPTQARLFDEMNILSTSYTTPELHEGSCLEILSTLETNSIDTVLTSPPYANRYDYTRTYALELVYLGCDEHDVKRLRQEMLSCTVENKSKQIRLKDFYRQREDAVAFEIVDTVFRQQKALQEVLLLLEQAKSQRTLNNPGIVTLIRNYFYEMSFVIYELSRLLKPGGTIIMVNDNVRYIGEEIPVDLILSDIAESFGLTVRTIWTLERGKGNSSQQMSNHGRSELRKCVYIWEKK